MIADPNRGILMVWPQFFQFDDTAYRKIEVLDSGCAYLNNRTAAG